MRWILRDRQINAQTDEQFTHEVRQVLTPGGVNNGSHISVPFDPSYQLVTLHWVRIWRGTNILNRLDPDKIQISQAGLDTDQLLFSAEKSALLILDDVRVGDVIDYAYSVQGNNPVFAGSFTGHILAQASHPMERSVTRLLWPSKRRLYVLNHGTDAKYRAVRKNDLIEFTWDFRNVPGWTLESSLPIWYNPLPWIQLSEFQKWGDVTQLALTLFTNTTPLSPELVQQINLWKKLPERESRVLQALRFVQEDVRYLGIETGASGYKPEAPSIVFARRFGDCKDKTFLFVTILHALGIEAWPEFVSTTHRQTVADFHASITVFDHVIAQVNLDGQRYWLDATANYQRGPLAMRSWPNYGVGLIIKPGTTALSTIPPCPVLPRTTVNQYIRLGPVDGLTDLKIVTVAEGADADVYREHFATTTRAEMERANLNYYARFYPNITQAAPLVFSDNEEQNRVEVDEFYTLQKIWSRLPDETFYHCRIYPENIDSTIRTPAISVRTMPLGLAYPVHQLYHAEIFVPSLLLLRPDEQTIENPAFYFRRTVSMGTAKLMLDYEYRSLADAVFPDAMPNYIRQLNSAVDLLSYTVPSD